MAVLGNPRHERAAQVIAGGGSAELAAAAAGFDTEGRSFAANARRLIQRPDIRERVKELQSEIAGKLVDVTAETIKQELATVAYADIEPDDVKPSDKIAALRELGKILGIYAPDKVEASGNMIIEIVKFAADKDSSPI